MHLGLLWVIRNDLIDWLSNVASAMGETIDLMQIVDGQCVTIPTTGLNTGEPKPLDRVGINTRAASDRYSDEKHKRSHGPNENKISHRRVVTNILATHRKGAVGFIAGLDRI